jgi:hypothetical protein
MHVTKLFGVMIVAVAGVPSAQGGAPAEVLDLAARVHYGYYHAEPQTIAVAEAGLARLGDAAEVVYYRDLAALRRAQLGVRDRESLRRLDECARRHSGTELAGRAAAEAWVLAAACALEAGDGRRFEQALAAARASDGDHPRIGLVEAWRLEQRGVATSAERSALAAKWAAVVAAFEALPPALEDPGWGQAEALVGLAENAWQLGEIRAARDLVERALLLAPGYGAAVEFRATVLAPRGGASTP